jgi:hypothetical protein
VAEPEVVEPLAWRLVDTELAAHLAVQAGWPQVTDSDRLSAAFRDLDSGGIVAREDVACCQSCGHAEIGDELRDGDTADGYVFYHRQDAQRAVEAGELYSRGPAAMACGYCDAEVSVHDWRWVSGCGMAAGFLGLTFWNWPPFSNSFVDRVSQQLATGSSSWTATSSPIPRLPCPTAGGPDNRSCGCPGTRRSGPTTVQC